MTTTKFQSEVLRKAEELMRVLPKERLRDVIERRFGLKDGNRQTLEEIGANYGITRERVRQVESDALKILILRNNLLILKPIFDFLDRTFEENDYLIGETKLLNSLTDTSEPHPSRSALLLVLTLGKPYQRFGECEKFYPYWTTRKAAKNNIEKIADFIIRYLNQQKQVYSFDDILSFISSKYGNLSQNVVLNALDISKNIEKNVYGDIGLTYWPEISPRGVRDKAYLILKRESKPSHFTEITNLINKANFSSRLAFSQTVHNELIKDERFILIGQRYLRS